MNIRYEEHFKNTLKEIILYIAKDKPSSADNFKQELKRTIENMAQNPKMYRASKYFNDNNYRDLTFKGYTIIYKIDEANKIISVLDIFKWINR